MKDLFSKFIKSGKSVDAFLSEEMEVSSDIAVAPENVARVIHIEGEPDSKDILKNSGLSLNKPKNPVKPKKSKSSG